MNAQSCRLSLSVALITAIAGSGSPAQAADPVPISQAPLYIESPVVPNLIMAIDNSGSMDGEMLNFTNDGAMWWNTANQSFTGLGVNDEAAPGRLNYNKAGGANATWKKYIYLFPNGTTTAGANRVYDDSGNDHFAVPPTAQYAFSRSPDFNANYFDPETDFLPFVGQDGVYYPAQNPATARCDLIKAPTCTINLTQDIEQTGANFRFRFYRGTTIPAGTKYRRMTGNACGATDAGWVTAAVNLAINAGTATDFCDVAVSYYAPTFYLPASRTLPASFGYKATAIQSEGLDPAGNALRKYTIKLANFDSEAQYNAAITNFANWFTYYRKRHQGLRTGISQAFQPINFMRVGFFQINNLPSPATNAVKMHNMGNGTDRTALYGSLDDVGVGSGGTPNREAVNALGGQFNLSPATVTSNSAPITLECQQNFGMLFTDGFANASNLSVGNQDGSLGAPFADTYSNTMADVATKWYTTRLRTDLAAGKVRTEQACNLASPDKRLDCQKNLHMNLFGVTLGTQGILFNPDTSDAINDPFTTGWNWGADPTATRNPIHVDDLWHAAVNTRGRFLNAKRPVDLRTQLNEVLADIASRVAKSSGVAASGARRSVGFTAYVPEFDTGSWTGDIKAYKLQPDGKLGSVTWSATTQLPAAADRKIWVSLPTGDAEKPYAASPFTHAGLGADEAAVRTVLGLTDSQFNTGGEFAGKTAADVVSFLRGDKTLESPVGPFRSRVVNTEHRPIGDILGSQPEVLERGTEGYTLLPVAQGGLLKSDQSLEALDKVGGYPKFVSTTKQNRTPVLIVGSNDGMIHGFNASTKAADASTRGKEIFAVVPNSVLSKTGQLAKKNYSHTYFVDGSPRLGDACIGDAPSGASANCGWKTVAVMNMGAGGKSVVALDVTDPAASGGFTATNFLWEFVHPELGHGLGRPTIFAGEDGVWYAAFGNGLNSTSHQAVVFIVDLKTGKFVKSFTLGSSGTATDPNGAASVIVVDGDGSPAPAEVTDGSVTRAAGAEEFNVYGDTLYVGDFHGKLWKIDLSSTKPANWAVALAGAPLFTATARDNKEVASMRQTITGSIEVGAHPIRGNFVTFGTGRYLTSSDRTVPAEPQVQTFYSIWDDPKQTTGVPGRTALLEQTITGADTTNGTRSTSANTISFFGTNAKRGWFIDLFKDGTGGFRDGERFIGEPRIELGRAIFTTFKPVGGDCSPGGKNWLYALNLTTGAAQLTLGSCTGGGCGAKDLNPTSSAPPAVAPPIVIDPGAGGTIDSDGDGTSDNEDGEFDCIRGVGTDCGSLPTDGAALPARACVANLGVLLSDGLNPFSQVSCGRQSWRQVR